MSANPMRQLEAAIVKGKINKIGCWTEKCLKAGFRPKTIIDRAVVSAMQQVGEKWKVYEYFIPNVLVSAMAIKLCLTALNPLLKKSQKQSLGKAVAGTVEGDIHDIGKNIVAIMLKGAGFEVTDLGNDVSVQRIVAAVKDNGAQYLGLSALLTTTMRAMESTIKALEEAGLRNKVKILIGGAPVTQSFADQIGADGYASNASAAAEMAKKFAGIG